LYLIFVPTSSLLQGVQIATMTFHFHHSLMQTHTERPNGLSSIQHNFETLRQGNTRLRGLIIAAVTLAQVNAYVSESHSLIDLAPWGFRREALKQFRKTAKVAHNRIEELRLKRKSVGFNLSPRDLKGSFRSSTNKHALADSQIIAEGQAVERSVESSADSDGEIRSGPRQDYLERVRTKRQGAMEAL